MPILNTKAIITTRQHRVRYLQFATKFGHKCYRSSCLQVCVNLLQDQHTHHISRKQQQKVTTYSEASMYL